MQNSVPSESVAQGVADQFARLPQVTAVALAGSKTAAVSDARSDIDLYIYSREAIPLSQREAIARQFASRSQLDNRFWEDGDEWLDDSTGVAVDVMYRSPAWIEQQLDHVLVKHEASVGYSTAFWANVLHSRALYDPEGWYEQLRRKAQQPYPEPLQRAIIAKNYPLMRTLLHSAYLHQLQSAIERGDLVSVQHRITAILASYFDILFAVNRQPHPGEKRLVQYVGQLPKTPDHFANDVHALIVSVGDTQQTIPAFNRLMDRLDALLVGEGLLGNIE